MGTTAPQEIPEFATTSEEGGVRAAIIDAARKVARRDGVVEMTLTGVAAEACVSATDIYAFFTSKNDLLQAVVADDLATLAKTMRQSLERQSDPPDTMSAPAGAAPARPVANGTGTVIAVAETIQDTQVPPTQAAEPLQTEEQARTETPAPVQGSPRRYPVVQARREPARPAAADESANVTAADAIARLQEQVAKLESSPVDQWLERRLREFERTLYALQHNQNHRAASNGSDSGLKSLRDSLEALDMRHAMAADEVARAAGERFDAVDKRLREMLSELQAESTHLARRVTALENLAFASRPEQMPPPVEAFAPVALPDPPEPFSGQTHETAEAAEDSAVQNSDGTAPSFLSAARRSASEAAAQQAHEDLRQKPAKPKTNKTMLYATCGLLVVFVVLLSGLGFVFRDESMDAPPVRTASKPVHVRVVRPAAATPVAATASLAKPAQRVASRMAPQTNLLKLATAGDASAELLVGLEYLEGKGAPKNEAMAVDWLSRAAAKGQPVAQYDLGALYADGRGVRADAVQAFQWFGSSALRGNRRAMHFLAIAYAEGVGTTKDLPEAARWFERAAALGAVNSQFNLAVLYERGLGVPQSLTTAYKWYALAAAQGDHEARARVAALESTLKPDDLASAKAAVDAFKPEPLDPAANLAPQPPA